jgi:hypothetical protein
VLRENPLGKECGWLSPEIARSPRNRQRLFKKGQKSNILKAPILVRRLENKYLREFVL